MADATQLSATRWRLTRDTPGLNGETIFDFHVPSGSSQSVVSLEQMYQDVFNPAPPAAPTIDDGTVIFFDRYQRPFTKQDLAKLVTEGSALSSSPPSFTDHFCFGSTETGEVGEQGWGFTNGTVSYAAPAQDRPGIMTRASAATAGNVASTYPLSSATTGMLVKADLQELAWSVLPVNPGLATYRVGIANDAAGNPPSDGFYLEALTTDINWFSVRRRAGAETRTDTGIPVSSGTWMDYRLRRVSTDNWEIFINGGAFQIIHTIGNIPLETDVMLPFSQIIPLTAVARSMHHDFFSLVMR